jgi:Big-like domain-containing protein
MVGTNLITATYDGDKNLTSSKSKVFNQVVERANTTTNIASSQNLSNFGQAVNFTATVTPQFIGTVTGNVTFYDGTTLLKAVWLSGGTAKFTTSHLGAGQHTITATYNGNASFSGRLAPLTQTVH